MCLTVHTMKHGLQDFYHTFSDDTVVKAREMGYTRFMDFLGCATAPSF